jgi:predicted permease
VANSLLENLLTLYLVVFIGGVIGFLLPKYRDKFTKFTNHLLMDVVVPIQMFLSLASTTFNVDTIFILQIVGVELYSVFILIAATWKIGQSRGVETKLLGSYIYLNAFPNALLYPLPIVLAFFGNELTIVLVIFSSSALVVRGTVGNYIGNKLGAQAETDWKKGLLKLFTFPPFVGVLIGFIFLGFNINLPPFLIIFNKQVFSPISSNVGAFIIGLILADINRERLKFYAHHIKIAAFWRFCIPFVLFLAIAFILQFPSYQKEIRTILLLVMLSPPAVFNVVYAVYFNLEAKFAAITVATLTLISLALMPLILWFGMAVF